MIDTIVFHSTVENTLAGSISILRERGFSYHYLIDRDGLAIQCVSPVNAAFHAGQSKGPQGEGVNEYSISISFVNENDGKHPLTDQQMEMARFIATRLKLTFKELRYVSSHASISPGRKTDPAGFSIEKFAEAVGLEPWL